MPIFNWFRNKKNAGGQEKETEAVQVNEPTEKCEEESALSVQEAVLIADEVLESEPDPKLSDMDFSDFWHDIKESERRYESNKPDQRMIRSVQEELGFKLPDTFVELMRMHNGGMVNRCWYPINFPAETYADYIQITHLLGIGRDAYYSLCGRFGSRFLLEGRGDFEKAGIAIANCISPSRAILILDYRTSGSDGEPCVTYINSASGEETVIAPNFEIFIRGLKTSQEALRQRE
ncbi:MAG: SMI1/KNR4 family protein [Clostridia bacterium]|nr:SMI1/KNR4 family protein [Clostridia bacterium]